MRIALDDFGAGASSFAYLRMLPVDYLKIDGQFITGLLNDPLNNAAVRCFCEVAKAVGVKTIAEFVERSDIRDALNTIGVDPPSRTARGIAPSSAAIHFKEATHLGEEPARGQVASAIALRGTKLNFAEKNAKP